MSELGAVFGKLGAVERLVAHPSLPLVAAIDSEWPAVHVLEIDAGGAAHKAVISTSSDGYPAEAWNRSARVPCATWHPSEAQLAVTSDDGILVWTPSSLGPLSGPPTAGGYRWLAFDDEGSHLYASPAAGDDWESCDFLDLALGAVGSGTRWDTGFSIHPGGRIRATLNSDQGATLVLFTVPNGDEGTPFRILDRALILDADGYDTPIFSPDGTRFAIRGNAYEQSLEVFDQLTLRRQWASILGDPSPGYPYPAEWHEQYRSWAQGNIAWRSNTDLLVGTPHGTIVNVDVATGTAEVAYDFGSAIRAITFDAQGNLLTALANREVRVTASERARSETRRAAIEAADDFASGCNVLPPDADPESSVRISDGVRTWEPGDLDSVTEAGADDPTWLQLQALMNSSRLGDS